MKRSWLTIVLFALICLQAFGHWPMDEIESYDTLLLGKNNISTTSESLTSWLKTRVVGKIPQETIEKLIQKLGDEQFENREKAARELQTLGFESVRALQKATRNPDPEISDRAKKCLSIISPNESSALKAAVIRKLALAAPRDFLDILPSMDHLNEDSIVLESLLDALYSIPKNIQNPDITATQLLKSKNINHQILGAWVIARTKPNAPLPLDTTPAIVQLNYGYALLRGRNPDGISWIIQALPGLKPHHAFQAANHLGQLADIKKVLANLKSRDRNIATIGNDLKNWWMDAKANFAFSNDGKVPLYPQRILASTMDLNANQGKVFEIRADYSIKALFTAPFYINHAVAIDHATILAGEQTRSLGAWTIGGDLLNRTDPRPGFTTLSLGENGHRFLYSSPEIQELDISNKSVKSSPVPAETGSATRLSNGDFVSITKKGELVLLDGKTPNTILHRWEGSNKFSTFQPIEPTRYGTFLISDPTSKEIREYDKNGRIIQFFPLTALGTTNISTYQSFLKLPNGNLLVGSRTTLNLSEIDLHGSEVKTIPLEGRLRKLFAMPVRMVLPD